MPMVRLFARIRHSIACVKPRQAFFPLRGNGMVAMTKPGTFGLAVTNQATSQEIERLQAALREIDDIAIRKESGAVVKMQRVARKALHYD
jgi:hypothetical protein